MLGKSNYRGALPRRNVDAAAAAVLQAILAIALQEDWLSGSFSMHLKLHAHGVHNSLVAVLAVVLVSHNIVGILLDNMDSPPFSRHNSQLRFQNRPL